LIDVQAVEPLVFRIEPKTAFEVLSPGLLVLGHLRMVRLGRPGAAKLLLLTVEGMNDIRAAAGQPHALLVGVESQSEPALPHDLFRHDAGFEQVDESQLVPVVSARRGQRQLAVLERNDVERQVGEGDLSAGGGDVPAVGEQVAGLSRPGGARLIVGREDRQGHDEDEQSGKRSAHSGSGGEGLGRTHGNILGVGHRSCPVKS
jgi:hypothetical protein